MPMPAYTGITVVDGPLGSGKSYYACRRIEAALWKRRPVVTNVQLVEDWAERIAARHLVGKGRADRRAALAAELHRYYYYSDDIADLLRREMHPPRKENQGLLLIDEAHAELNSRLFQQEGRSEMVQRIRQLRKLGWEAVFISQNIESIDKQVRDAITYRIHLVNWRRRYWWFPFNLFLAVHFFAGDKFTAKGTKPFARELYRLDKYTANLYDTYSLFGVVRAERPPTHELLPFALARAQLASTGSANDELS